MWNGDKINYSNNEKSSSKKTVNLNLIKFKDIYLY